MRIITQSFSKKRSANLFPERSVSHSYYFSISTAGNQTAATTLTISLSVLILSIQTSYELPTGYPTDSLLKLLLLTLHKYLTTTQNLSMWPKTRLFHCDGSQQNLWLVEALLVKDLLQHQGSGQ